MLTLGSEIWLRGFDLTVVSMEEIIQNETAKLVQVQKDIEDPFDIDLYLTTSLPLIFPLSVDKVKFETFILDMPAKLEYTFYNDRLFHVKYILYRDKVIIPSYRYMILDTLEFILQEKYGTPVDVTSSTIQFIQNQLVVILRQLTSSSAIEICYIITPVSEEIMDTKHKERMYKFFEPTLIEETAGVL